MRYLEQFKLPVILAGTFAALFCMGFLTAGCTTGLKPPTVQSITGRSAEIELLVAQADKTALDAGKALNPGDLASLRAYTGRIARANDGAIAATHQAVISGSMAKLPAAMLTLASALSADPHIAALLGVVNALGALAQQIYSLFPENQ